MTQRKKTVKTNKKVIFIVGPTSSGKTDVAIALAREFNGELVSADSRQVYRGLDIGTGKDKSYPHHLIDIKNPGGAMFSLGEFLRRANELLPQIWEKGKVPIVVGGTGLYITALLKGYKLPKKKMGRGRWHKQEKPAFDTLVIALDVPRAVLYQRIDERLRRRMEEGLIAEVEGLIRAGVEAKWLNKLGLEYRYVTNYLAGEYGNEEELYNKLRFAIHRYARRQLTWLRHQINGVEWTRGLPCARVKVKQFLH
ncbi:MAG TPA: tRNA (adenosine(37)-N6)-dimethylallyltransferase MiaA [bacterium]|nr:tRNA (adenosine(37)-N6)-dimethylallyltransferase MiaA [bacterium]HOR57264.1 tRNA (adenosine(37)-N6)-dimethylallyltransferase MiaA [bacterium]HPL56295.1 tRNA (adenosine(37)-N6)-dimethylallyltransferase MiaA [bacterium]